MSYVEKHLIDNESVVYTTGLHWVVILWPLFLTLILAGPGVALLIYALSGQGQGTEAHGAMIAGGLILVVIGAICFISGLVKRNATEMAVTDKRVIIKVGIATRRTFELLLQKVESIGVEESATGRMLGYGTVIIRGTGGTPEPFDRVAHPIEFRKRVQEQIEKLLDRTR